MPRNKKATSDKYNSPFATNLRHLMEVHKTTQEALAGAIEKTRQTVSQYTLGTSEPGYETLVRIANYYDVTLDYLLGRTEDPRKNPCAMDDLGITERSASILLTYQTLGIGKYFLQYVNEMIEIGCEDGFLGDYILLKYAASQKQEVELYDAHSDVTKLYEAMEYCKSRGYIPLEPNECFRYYLSNFIENIKRAIMNRK